MNCILLSYAPWGLNGMHAISWIMKKWSSFLKWKTKDLSLTFFMYKYLKQITTSLLGDASPVLKNLKVETFLSNCGVQVSMKY